MDMLQIHSHTLINNYIKVSRYDYDTKIPSKYKTRKAFLNLNASSLSRD